MFNITKGVMKNSQSNQEQKKKIDVGSRFGKWFRQHSVKYITFLSFIKMQQLASWSCKSLRLKQDFNSHQVALTFMPIKLIFVNNHKINKRASHYSYV